MKKSPKFTICVSGAAEISCCCPQIQKLAKEIGREIARQECILITGATTGVPSLAIEGFKEIGGLSIGFSPAKSRKEHTKTYRLPTKHFDLIIYTGFDYVGRNLMLTKAADGVIIICGRTGTLNEFTIAFESKIPIGVLQETGGTADFIDDILKKGHRPLTRIIYNKDPKKLVQDLIKIIKAQRDDESEK
jgi:uncharacterized protein (TIGR00725 family)